ncbi:protein-export membrane protein SecD, partial [Vibrio parahaemolyticus EKP-028]
QRI